MSQAAVYEGNRCFVVEQRDPVDPATGEVEIAVAYTGICGTDLHIFHGDMDARVSTPCVIGHEMSGRISKIGDGVDGWHIGDPVTVMPVISCGTCPACRAGHTHICHRLDFVGIDSTGSMQNRWTVPSNLLVPLPDGLSLRDAALVEPTAVAVHDVRRAELVIGAFVAVIGGGPIGLLIATVARHAGAQIVVFETNAYRRSVAEGLGFTTIDPSAVQVAAIVDEWTKGAGCSVSFEVSGAAAGVALAVDVLATRGRVVMVAIHLTPRPVDLHRFFWRELTMSGARLYERQDFDSAVELVAGGVIPADVLITNIEPLSSVADAFSIFESASTVMKLLIDCQADR